MKKIEVVNLHKFLVNNEKFGKMGTSKVTLVMMLVKMGKVVDDYNNTQKEVLEKLKKECENWDENLMKAQTYEAYKMALADKEAGKEVSEDRLKEPEFTEETYRAYMDGDYKKVIEPLEQAMREEGDKEADLDYKKFDEQGFSEWIEANNIDALVAASLAQYLLDM